MNPKIRRLTETAMLLALLLCLQWMGSPIADLTTKQLITGSCVNCVLAVAALLVGMGSGITLALISPIFAFFLGIAPNLITVGPIMLGNVCFVVALGLLCKGGRPLWQRVGGLAAAAAAKFAVLYLLVVQLVCGLASGALLGKKLGQWVLLAPPMLKLLPAMFGWLQLVTALIGGSLALLLAPTLRKALRR